MSEFKREHRYWVVKRKYLSEQEDELLAEFADDHSEEVMPTCVVVESDWAEYETIWRMIQDRVEGRPNELATLRAENERKDERIAGLEQALTKIKNDVVAEPQSRRIAQAALQPAQEVERG